MIQQETIQQIIDAADIVEVVSDFVSLKKRGVNYIGLCPFHNEKTPSFTVSPAKGICKCFGCGKGGNSVAFIMEHEQMTYVEALRYLARKYHIDIVEREETEEERIQKNERESLLIVTDYAKKRFVETLAHDREGTSVGLSYFKERGFRMDTIKKFELGYCKNNWADFSDKALQDGYESKYLIDAGLSINGNKGLIDKFRGRVIFPIHSVSGRTVGFGGRILSNDKKTAKYLNSPESAIYHKSKELYGLYFAKKSIVQDNKCFLVEGYTDVISLHQSGISNVVASSGTSLTTEQIRLIKRFTSNITVLFDGDMAGVKASLRSIDMLLAQSMNIRVLLLPDGEDPDSFAKKHSSSEFKEYIINHEEDFIHFKVNLIKKEAQNDPVKKAELIRDIIRSIATIPDNITRSVYIKNCSTLLDIKEETIYQQITKRLIEQRGTKQTTATTTANKEEVSTVILSKDYEEKAILRLLLNYGMTPMNPAEEEIVLVGEYIIEQFDIDEIKFPEKTYQQIFDDFKKQSKQSDFAPNIFFRDHENRDIARLSLELLTENHKLSKIWTKNNMQIDLEEHHLRTIVPKAVYQYKYKIIKQMQDDIKAKIKSCTDDDILMGLIQEKQQIDMLKKDVLEIIGKRIIVN